MYKHNNSSNMWEREPARERQGAEDGSKDVFGTKQRNPRARVRAAHMHQARDCHASCCLFFLYSFIFSSASRKNEANAGETYSTMSSRLHSNQ